MSGGHTVGPRARRRNDSGDLRRLGRQTPESRSN